MLPYQFANIESTSSVNELARCAASIETQERMKDLQRFVDNFIDRYCKRTPNNQCSFFSMSSKHPLIEQCQIKLARNPVVAPARVLSAPSRLFRHDDLQLQSARNWQTPAFYSTLDDSIKWVILAVPGCEVSVCFHAYCSHIQQTKGDMQLVECQLSLVASQQGIHFDPPLASMPAERHELAKVFKDLKSKVSDRHFNQIYAILCRMFN